MPNKTRASRPTKTAERYIIQETKIDKFTTKRVRVPLHPGVCDVCAFDVARANRLDPQSTDAATLRDLVARHKKVEHTPATAKIVSASEIPSQWTGREDWLDGKSDA